MKSAIGHVGNFLYKLDTLNVEEEVWKAILKSTAVQGLNYRTWLELLPNGEYKSVNSDAVAAMSPEECRSHHYLVLQTTIYGHWPRISHWTFVGGRRLPNGLPAPGYMSIEEAMERFPDIATFHWKSVGPQPGYERCEGYPLNG